MQSHLNVGFGSDITIADLAKAVGSAVGYQGRIIFDSTKPDGPPRKWMNSSRMSKLELKPEVSLDRGLQVAYRSFLENHS